MIQEAFVSYQTAILLKEKGFNEPCLFYYDNREHELHLTDEFMRNEENALTYVDYIAPSLALAMRWLREVHKIVISMEAIYYCSGNGFYWKTRINPMTEPHHDPIWISYPENKECYEQSVEDTIKYCLENLI